MKVTITKHNFIKLTPEHDGDYAFLELWSERTVRLASSEYSSGQTRSLTIEFVVEDAEPQDMSPPLDGAKDGFVTPDKVQFRGMAMDYPPLPSAATGGNVPRYGEKGGFVGGTSGQILCSKHGWADPFTTSGHEAVCSECSRESSPDLDPAKVREAVDAFEKSKQERFDQAANAVLTKALGVDCSKLTEDDVPLDRDVL